MDIALSPESQTLIADKIRSGRFGSADEVVNAALMVLDANDQAMEKRLEELRCEISKAELQYENGEFIKISSEEDLRDLSQSIMARGRERLAALKA